MNNPIRGIFGFNGHVVYQQYVKKLLLDLGIDRCIETGTFQGWTTAFFAEIVKNVCTIEINSTYYLEAQKNLEGYNNVQQSFGSSPAILTDLLPEIPSTEKILFFLDAHWNQYWPLYDELTVIGRDIGRRAIILIDDFMVPGKNYAYDHYENRINDLPSATSYLKTIYPDFYYEYLDGGDPDYQLVLDESQLTDEEKRIYIEKFKGQILRAPGKILIKDNPAPTPQ